MTAATHLLVGNPTAQSGKNRARIDRARVLLRQAGVLCDFLPTEPHGRTVARVRDALKAENYAVVIAQGGDGTFREVGAGVLDCGRPEEVAVAMLPTGTANDTGKSFGMHAGDDALPSNVAVIAESNETRLDVGWITVRPQPRAEAMRVCFFDSAGWGISARILAARNADRRIVQHLSPLGAIYRDQWVYAGAALRVFLESYVVTDKFDAVIEYDGQSRQLSGLTDLIVKGTRVYAGAWVFDRTSKHDDGYFEVVPFRGKRDWTSKAVVDLQGNPITEELLNAIGIRHSKPFRVAHARLRLYQPRASVPLAAQVDGEEFWATSEVNIDVDKQALRLIVPPRSRWELGN
jgi:diacylglycerol kinase family enzyme